MSFDISSYLDSRRRIVNEQLEFYVAGSPDKSTALFESIEYGIFAGGKRLRPVLCMAACEAVAGKYDKSLPVACAIEMIHTYSLIHDDLPSMDNDELRRGKPTNHSRFGEAVAILTGDALLTDAFGIIVSGGNRVGLTSQQITDIIGEVSQASGSRGMVLGQAIDLELEGRTDVGIDTLKEMHSLKTGALIEGSVASGAISGGARPEQKEYLRSYARSIGLAYQIIDDVLDVEGGKSLGKNKGSDNRKLKTTYISVLGLDRSKELAAELTEEAVKSLENFNGSTTHLTELAYYLGKREY